MSKADELEFGNEAPAPEAPVSLGQRLDDKDFLNFLQKNKDAVKYATNDEYISQKADIFDKLKQVKQKAKKFIVGESDESYGDVVEGTFFDRMEDIAIDSPKDFLDFHANLDRYLKSEEESRELAEQYKEAAKFLGVEYGDFSTMSGSEREAFVEDIHTKLQEMKLDSLHTLETTESLQPLLSRIPFTLKRKVWLDSIELIKKNIDDIKLVSANLDGNRISGLINQVESVKVFLRGNKAFKFLHEAFTDEAGRRLGEAYDNKDNKSLVEQGSVLARVANRQTIITKEEYREVEKQISRQFKKTVREGSVEVAENKENITYSSLQEGLNGMYEKGLELGLSESECRGEIVSALKSKEVELSQSTDRDSQANIKLILIRRMLINVE